MGRHWGKERWKEINMRWKSWQNQNIQKAATCKSHTEKEKLTERIRNENLLFKKRGGLREWVKQNWVDIANKKSDGSYPKCGRSGGEKRKNYPKCVPIAKARAMSKGQRAGAVRRKQAKANKALHLVELQHLQRKKKEKA